jgi:hypothetical protein
MKATAGRVVRLRRVPRHDRLKRGRHPVALPVAAVPEPAHALHDRLAHRLARHVQPQATVHVVIETATLV